MNPLKWTLEGFVEHFGFVHHKMLDHKFTWVLGAGASFASGIPLGSRLVDLWLEDLYRRDETENIPLEDWATAERLEIPNFTFSNRAGFYPRIYQKRFRYYPEEGYAYLESVMSRKDPSPGYSILASALAADPPRHNVVITTNFDNLVADALSIYTDTFPFVCGHESLTAFVRVAMRRPLICKIHRDLLLGPQNDPRSLRRLHDAWGLALRSLFQHYTPVFIGYGGNDDTLMDLLESLQPGDIKGQLIWCYYEGSEPSERIISVVTDHSGVLVPVPDFDLLMVLLGEKMGVSLLDEEINHRAEKRTEQYRHRIQLLDTVTHPAVARALAATLERSGGWWAWEQKARAEKDHDRRETVYRQALEHLPKSAELLGKYATFLREVRLNNAAAEQLLRKGVEINTKEGFPANNLAGHLMVTGGDIDEAEKLFRGAVERQPDSNIIVANLANFLSNKRKKHDEAEALLLKAASLNAKEPTTWVKYVGLLLVQQRIAEAKEMLNRASPIPSESRFDSVLALYHLVIERAFGIAEKKTLERLQESLKTKREPSFWVFDNLLEFSAINLKEHYKLISALVEAIKTGKPVTRFNNLAKTRSRGGRGERISASVRSGNGTGKSKEDRVTSGKDDAN